MAFSKEYRCDIINPNDVPTIPCGVGTDKVGFIDIIAFGKDKQAYRFMIIKRSRVCACTSERAQIAPRWLVKRRAECIALSGNAYTAKEYNWSAAHECGR